MKISKEEKIIDLRKEIEKLKELIGMMKGDFTSGNYSDYGLPSTKSYLSITFDYKSVFSPSVLSCKFSEKLSAEVAIPIFAEKLEKRERELYELEHSFWDKILKHL